MFIESSNHNDNSNNNNNNTDDNDKNNNTDNNNNNMCNHNPPTHRWSSVLGELNILPFASMTIPHPLVFNSTQIPHDATKTRSHINSYTAQIQLTQHQLSFDNNENNNDDICIL